MKRIGKVLAATTLGVTLAIGGAVAPASAADGYVYVVVRDTACGAWPAKVTGIQTANITTGWSLNWDYGDNIVYPKVRLNANNVLKLNLRCSAWGRVVGYTVIQPTIYPTSYNQTIWVG